MCDYSIARKHCWPASAEMGDEQNIKMKGTSLSRLSEKYARKLLTGVVDESVKYSASREE